MSHRTLLLAAAFALLLVACGDGDDDSTTTPAPTSGTGDASDLVGTEWIVDGFVVDGGEFPLVSGADPTIEFSAERSEIAGTTGCNSYFAEVDYGTAGELIVGGVGQTEMACAPEEIMNQERQFTAALSTLRFYEIDGDRLTLVDGVGSVQITAVNRGSVELPIGLGDVTWIADTRIEAEAASTMVPDTAVTVRFDVAAGILGGFSGCNDFGAEFVVDDDRIRVTELAAEGEGCGDRVMEQEQFIYDVLADADTFTIDRDRLTVMTADGRGLGFLAGE
jgi:heat shock protein HslJ